jgi:hypothetical protein
LRSFRSDSDQILPAMSLSESLSIFLPICVVGVSARTAAADARPMASASVKRRERMKPLL